MDFEKIKVNFSGKEYIEYMKYRDKIKKTQNKFLKENFKIIMLGVFILIGAIITLFVVTYEPSKTTEFTWEGILMFLTVCAGIGWILHGVGFTIIGKLR